MSMSEARDTFLFIIIFDALYTSVKFFYFDVSLSPSGAACFFTLCKYEKGWFEIVSNKILKQLLPGPWYLQYDLF